MNIIRSLLFTVCFVVACLVHADDSGEEFFATRVLPNLAQNGCISCHSPGPGYVKPEINYRDLLSYLAMGDGPENNVLLIKLANLRSFAPDRPAHMGGQRCRSVQDETCQQLLQWWQIEFGDKP